jgi:hypothetical protein
MRLVVSTGSDVEVVVEVVGSDVVEVVVADAC